MGAEDGFHKREGRTPVIGTVAAVGGKGGGGRPDMALNVRNCVFFAHKRSGLEPNDAILA